MPNPSSASDSSSVNRGQVADDLYLKRGADDASHRCDVNTKLGAKDLVYVLLEKLDLKPGDVILDVGCGTGQHLVKFAEVVGPTGHAYGVDFNPDAVAKAKALGLDVEVASAEKLPQATNSVDALTCNYAIYYVENLQAALDEFGRVCKEGARLVITGPSKDTNQELYEFHKKATGAEPSDADKMALGYVQGPVAAGLAKAGFGRTAIEEFTNPIEFPDADSFLDYWVATSLFARTGHATRQMGAEILAGKDPPFLITKRTTVLSAVKAR
ncbi:MAG TPA: methyltransferase domain-containing protein [bacterium]|nr:methyltransferase domain-containing protein [bacterium]